MAGRFFLLVVLLLGSSSAFAQTGFYEAGYILLQGDTVQGFVERLDEMKISKSVNFKQELTDVPPVNYVPEALGGVGFYKDGVHFRSVPVEIRLLNHITTVQRFAKVLLQGYVDLYKVQLQPGEQSVIHRTDNTHVYVIRKEEAYYTLGQYEYQEEYKVGLNKRYIGMLKAVLSECTSSKQKYEKLNFDDKELVKAVSAYNACIRPDMPESHMTYEVKPVVRHGLEVSYGKAVVPGYLFSSSNHAGGIGYFWDILRPDISRNKSVRLGLSYYYTNYQFLPRNVNMEEVKNENSLRMPLLGQFNLAKNADAAFSPFFNVGMTAQLAATTQLDNMGIYTFLTLGAGMYLNNYRFSFVMDSDNFWPISVKLLNLSVGYRFDSNKK